MMTAEYHDCWTELAAAIVAQASKDYVRALVGLHTNPKNTRHRKMIQECEQFFRSAWCAMLSDIDAELIIDRLRHMAAQEIRAKEAKKDD